MQIDDTIYNWMCELTVLKKDGILTDNGKVQLTEESSKQLESGYKVGELIKFVAERISSPKKSYTVNISKIKNQLSPAAKVFNWNEIQKQLNNLDITLENDIKSLIITGDNELLTTILWDLYQKYVQFVAQGIPKGQNVISEN